MIGIDYLGPFNPVCDGTNNQYVILVVDYFSRFAWALAVEHNDGETAVQQRYITYHCNHEQTKGYPLCNVRYSDTAQFKSPTPPPQLHACPLPAPQSTALYETAPTLCYTPFVNPGRSSMAGHMSGPLSNRPTKIVFTNGPTIRAAQTGVFDVDIRISNRPFIDICKSFAAQPSLKYRNVEKRINAL
jgi:hypothetical protein